MVVVVEVVTSVTVCGIFGMAPPHGAIKSISTA